MVVQWIALTEASVATASSMHGSRSLKPRSPILVSSSLPSVHLGLHVEVSQVSSRDAVFVHESRSILMLFCRGCVFQATPAYCEHTSMDAVNPRRRHMPVSAMQSGRSVLATRSFIGLHVHSEVSMASLAAGRGRECCILTVACTVIASWVTCLQQEIAVNMNDVSAMKAVHKISAAAPHKDNGD